MVFPQENPMIPNRIHLLCSMSLPLFFRETGAGAPLIILHGIFGSGENWLTVSKKFADQFRVLLPDQRNHGRSPHTDAFSYSLLADDLETFATNQGINRFYLIGHSMGGKVAMQFAQQHPERLLGLVVVDIAPRHYPPHHTAVLQGLKAVDLGTCQSRNEADAAMAQYITESDVRQFLLKNLYRNESGKFAWRINLPVLERAALQVGEATNPEIVSRVPALFIRGGKSRYILPQDEDLIYHLFPLSQIKEIPDAGHWVHAERPEAFAEMVLNFFTECRK
jgi:pimeloyl-ACP methyl ester carboxylesterase